MGQLKKRKRKALEKDQGKRKVAKKDERKRKVAKETQVELERFFIAEEVSHTSPRPCIYPLLCDELLTSPLDLEERPAQPHFPSRDLTSRALGHDIRLSDLERYYHIRIDRKGDRLSRQATLSISWKRDVVQESDDNLCEHLR